VSHGRRRGAAHDSQIVLLALLHLIAGTMLSGGLLYAGALLAFLVISPAALLLSHLRREVEGNYQQGARDRTGSPVDVPRILRSRRVIGPRFLAFTFTLSLPILLFTGLLFVTFPRVGLSLLLVGRATPERMVGFSDHVDLGGVGRLRSDPALAARLHYEDLPATPPARLAVYLRGTAFEHYDGRAWSRAEGDPRPLQQRGRLTLLQRPPRPEEDRAVDVELQPIDPPVVFLPPNAVAIQVERAGNATNSPIPRLLGGPEDEVRYASPEERGLRYRVWTSATSESPQAVVLSEESRRRHLELPPKLPQRVSELARTWAGALSDPFEQAAVIERRLRAEYRYDLASPSGAAADPLDDFLFVSRRGHCEFYSTAMAVLLRTLGIPTRNVTGFAGATFNSFGGFYSVRQGDAHSWVEAFLPGRGWVRFDPTPPSEVGPQAFDEGLSFRFREFMEALARGYEHHVVGYNLHQQTWLWDKARTRYDRLQGSPSGRALLTSRRGIALGAGLLLLLVALVVWVRRAHRRPTGAAHGTTPPPQIARIVRHFMELDRALRARGVGRPEGTPPLSHALALSEAGHPLGGEALALTARYLEVRFGGATIDDQELERYRRRVRAIATGKSAAA